MTYEVAILINGRAKLREFTRWRPADVAMLIAQNMPALQEMGRVAVIVTHPSGLREIVARSRPQP